VEAVTAEEAAGGVAGVVLMGGRWDSVSLGLLEENERKGRGLPRFGFAREGGCPLWRVAEGKKKIKGRGEVCEGCSGVWVCGGMQRRLSGGVWRPRWREKKKKGKAVFRKTGQEKLILCQL